MEDDQDNHLRHFGNNLFRKCLLCADIEWLGKYTGT